MKRRSALKSDRILEKVAQESLLALLADVPIVTVIRERSLDRRASDLGIGIAVAIRVGRANHTLAVEVKGAGQARDARTAASALQRYANGRREIYGIFCAPYVSESAANVCAELGLGFFDLSGNCRLA